MKEWRINLIFIFILIFSFTLIGRLYYLQILKTSYYRALSQGLYNSFSEKKAERGKILLEDGRSLAINFDFPLVFVSPRRIKDFSKTSQILAEILNLDKDFILRKLEENKEKFYLEIKKKLNQEEVEKLKNLKMEGVFVSQERGRYYPQGKFASQLIGFLDAQGNGQYGLEGSFDQILKGEDGISKIEEGSDLILTIDYNIQFVAEKLLSKAKEDLDIEKGEIIVLDPNSGKIFALANFPNFDPNKYEDYAKEGNLEIFKNGATQELFEPGSVFKPITMAAALEEGKITPQTTYFDEGFVKIGGYTIYNYDQRKYNEQNMTNVLEKSINTGAVFVEKKLGNDLFLKYIEKFGFFEPTGIEIPEIYSQNKELKKGYEINFATASFGQGIEITPIQLARAYCAIANGGKLVRPYLVEKIIKNGKIIEMEPEISQPIISSKTSSQLVAMLVSVVENGFGKRAKIPGYFIAGKTGTAQISYSALGIDKSGYSEKTIQTFVGFAPAFNPRFLILVKLQNPKTKTAEYSAVPIFHDLTEYIINYWQIPPDYEPNQEN